MNISEFITLEFDAPPINEMNSKEDESEMPKKKLSEKALKKSEEFFAQKALERKTRGKLKQDGMDLFFRKESYIPADPGEFEGHFPGNQNNPVLIPYAKRVKHVSGK